MSGTAGDCIFCRIARGEFGTEFVAETEHAVAFRDLEPQAPTHVLVVPKQHIRSLQHLDPSAASIAAELMLLAVDVARQDGILESGYRVLTNDGADAGQTVHHLHLHVLGGKPLQSGLG